MANFFGYFFLFFSAFSRIRVVVGFGIWNLGLGLRNLEFGNWLFGIGIGY
jgi:hypothetical protein